MGTPHSEVGFTRFRCKSFSRHPLPQTLANAFMNQLPMNTWSGCALGTWSAGTHSENLVNGSRCFHLPTTFPEGIISFWVGRSCIVNKFITSVSRAWDVSWRGGGSDYPENDSVRGSLTKERHSDFLNFCDDSALCVCVDLKFSILPRYLC